jgi:hypothetical protein
MSSPVAVSLPARVILANPAKEPSILAVGGSPAFWSKGGMRPFSGR